MANTELVIRGWGAFPGLLEAVTKVLPHAERVSVAEHETLAPRLSLHLPVQIIPPTHLTVTVVVQVPLVNGQLPKEPA